jgi:putative acetyltransferase
MRLQIEPLSSSHFERLHELFDTVCREKRFMAFTSGGPRADALSYYQGILDRSETHFVATEGTALVGWCDVNRNFADVRRHSGGLGMAVAASHRGKGIGRALITRAIEHASNRGISRIELTVHSDNTVAQNLYSSVGFVREGTHRNAWLIDGQYFNVHFMARVSEA